MPKMKTHRGTAKRMSVTATGRVRRGKAGASHMMRGKPARRLRNLRKNDIVDATDQKRIKRLLPHAY
jgi:large subunit ribosomal protein L35